MNKYKFNMEIEVSKENIDDIVSMALEGGINYWCDRAEAINTNKFDCDEFYISELISKGKILILHNKINNRLHELNISHVIRGLKQYMQNEGITIRNDSKIDMSRIDASVADMIIQYGLFEEVIYG